MILNMFYIFGCLYFLFWEMPVHKIFSLLTEVFVFIVVSFLSYLQRLDFDFIVEIG